jgi:uridine kinase
MKQDKPDRIQFIIKRDGTLVPHDGRRIHNAILKGARAIGLADAELATRLTERVEAALVETYGSAAHPSVEDIQDIVESVLMEEGHVEMAKEYIIYRHERSRLREAKAPRFDVTDNIPYRKLYEVLRWNVEHECHTVPALNRLIARGDFAELICAADQRYDDELKLAADIILGRLPDTRIVIVAGPSSSGKTTTTIKISEHLAREGIAFRAMNIDHYFFNIEAHPRDEFGDYDYERPHALDLPLIDEHLSMLLDGKSVKTPNYDFKTGKRTLDVHPLQLKTNELLLIDSLHGLFDDMTRSIANSHKFKLYIESLGQLRGVDGAYMRWADKRLLRRMIRDMQHRDMGPIETLTHWHYVRKSELTDIIPYIKNADYVVNSDLPYELPILKTRLFKYIRSAATKFHQDPRRLDAHIRANRVHDLLKPLRGIRDDSCIPGKSLLREFIGGSEYTY